MNAAVRTPLGVELRGVTLAEVTGAQVEHLRLLLARHGVVVLRGQAADDDAFVAFLARFGSLTFTRGETPVEGHPDLNLISNVGRTTPPRSVFHVDTSYVRHPPAYTALRAVEIPDQGGNTEFSNQYRAYETLDRQLRQRLAGRSIRHAISDPAAGADDETAADHPVFRRHPVSGRIALYLSTPERCVAVSGLDDAEGRAVIEQLYAHSIAADNLHHHTWAPGDVVMWDNRCVMHRADHSGVVGNRVMHRGMVASDPAARS